MDAALALNSEDRRKSVRYPCELAAACRPAGGRDYWPAWVRDLSAGGAALDVERQLDPGTQLTIELPAPMRERLGQLPARVVHATPEPGERWRFGCAFTEQLDADDLHATLRPRPGILLVEEEQPVRKVLHMVLQVHGFGVWPAGSGAEAEALYRQHHDGVALVLLDVGMAGRDGVETLAALQAIDPDVRCWFMTGGSTRYNEAELLRRGAARVLPKPFPVADVIQQLRQEVGL
jgi:two-component system OmpR family response regulator